MSNEHVVCGRRARLGRTAIGLGGPTTARESHTFAYGPGQGYLISQRGSGVCVRDTSERDRLWRERATLAGREESDFGEKRKKTC